MIWWFAMGLVLIFFGAMEYDVSTDKDNQLPVGCRSAFMGGTILAVVAILWLVDHLRIVA